MMATCFENQRPASKQSRGAFKCIKVASETRLDLPGWIFRKDRYRNRRKQKWRPQCIAVKYSLLNFEFPDNSLDDKLLRFNPIQVAEWLAELLAGKGGVSQYSLASSLGMSQTRVWQFLRLMKLPDKERERLRQDSGVTEYGIRGMVAGKMAALTAGMN